MNSLTFLFVPARVLFMQTSGIRSPRGPIEWGSKDRKDEAKQRRHTFKTAAIKDAQFNG